MCALARRHHDAAIELMARDELARFAVGRMGIERGHSIDRREVSLLFSEASDAPARAGEFFAAFAYIYSFFGADNAICRQCRGNWGVRLATSAKSLLLLGWVAALRWSPRCSRAGFGR